MVKTTMPPSVANVWNGWPATASTTASHTQMAVATMIPSVVPSRSESWLPARETMALPRTREYAPAARAGIARRLILQSPCGGCALSLRALRVWLGVPHGGGNQAVVLCGGTRVVCGLRRRDHGRVSISDDSITEWFRSVRDERRGSPPRDGCACRAFDSRGTGDCEGFAMRYRALSPLAQVSFLARIGSATAAPAASARGRARDDVLHPRAV